MFISINFNTRILLWQIQRIVIIILFERVYIECSILTLIIFAIGRKYFLVVTSLNCELSSEKDSVLCICTIIINEGLLTKVVHLVSI